MGAAFILEKERREGTLGTERRGRFLLLID